MRPISSVILATAIPLFALIGAFALNIPPTPPPPVNAEPAIGFQPPVSPPQPSAPTARFDEYQVAPETPQRKTVESIQLPEPLDKAPYPISPEASLNPSIKPDLSAEMAKMKLMELENAWNKLNEIHTTQSKEIENLKLTAKTFYDRSVKYYNAGNYRLSLVYSHLSLEIIRAIEEIGR